MELYCSSCKIYLDCINFSKKECKRWYSYKCKQCHNKYSRDVWYNKNKEKQKQSNIKWKKSNREKLISMRLWVNHNDVVNLIATRDCCAICWLKDRLCVDHCHSSGKVRWLLCSKCNSWIWMFNEDISLLEEAIKYIKNTMGS